MSRHTFRRPVALLIVVGGTCLLAACMAPGGARRQASRPVPSNAQMVQAIRAAGAREQSVINVDPLRNPGVASLRDAAHNDESNGHYADAASKLDQALKLSADAPDLLQDRAEAAVYLGDYVTAERLARRSWSLGPKLGPLCARNWQTVVELRLHAGDSAGAANARKQVATCHKADVPRF